jgi:16S rRNA (adenine1518-N6/adenine1519-N6)-dimethyltransferase
LKHIARKRFGQHFLTDESVIDSIVAIVDPQRDDAMVEIGPGLGALTGPLSERLDALTVVELDRDLAARLRKRDGLRVVEADVLTVDFATLAGELKRPLRIVGNLPYNISTPILFHLLAHVDHVRDQHFMLQREVVERMAAQPGNKSYGRLTVMLQWRYAIEAVLDVPESAFEPPPRVQSAVVRMEPLPEVDVRGVADLAEIVSVAFSQRRKMLRHTLGRWLAERGYAGRFDTQRRAEEVPVREYLALAREVGGAAA